MIMLLPINDWRRYTEKIKEIGIDASPFSLPPSKCANDPNRGIISLHRNVPYVFLTSVTFSVAKTLLFTRFIFVEGRSSMCYNDSYYL